MTTRQSPLHQAHQALGAKFVDFGGWEMPLSYPSGTLAEHLACRRDVVVFDVSHLGTIRLLGAEAKTALQLAFTNDLDRIGPGRAQYTHLLEEKDASVLDDCIVWWVDEERFDVMPNASNTTRVSAAIGGVDVTGERAVVAIQGPNARRTLATFSPEAAAVAHFGVERFRFHDVECIVAGTGYTGEDGVECAIPSELAPRFWEEILGAGAKPAGLGARDTLRLEAGLPLHGHELGPGITPLQAGLSWVVSFDKPAFIGRAALLAEQQAGVSRRLRGLLSSTRRPLHQGERVLSGDEVLGEVTSGNFSPLLELGIGLALLQAAVVLEREVEIQSRGSRTAAKVVRPPFTRLTGPPSTK